MSSLVIAVVVVVGAVVITCIVAATCLIWRWLSVVATRQTMDSSDIRSPQVVTLEIKVSDGDGTDSSVSNHTRFGSSPRLDSDSLADVRLSRKKRRETQLLDELFKKLEIFEKTDNLQDLESSMQLISSKALSLRSLNFAQINVKDMFQFENFSELCTDGSNSYGTVVVHEDQLRNVVTKNFAEGTGNTAQQIQAYLKHINMHNVRDLKLTVSPAHALTLPDEKKVLANIPETATHYCYCYPIATTEQWPDGVEKNDPLLDLFHYGGFMYFDVSHQTPEIMAINSFIADGEPDCKVLLGKCIPMTKKSVQALQRAGRWKPVTLWTSAESTVAHAWVIPNEKVGDKQFTRSGGFAYRYSHRQTGKENGFFFPVIGSESEHARYELSDVREAVYFEELQPVNAGVRNDGAAGEGKFSGVKYTMVTGLDIGIDSNVSLHTLLGITKAELGRAQRRGVDAVRDEWEALARQKSEAAVAAAVVGGGAAASEKLLRVLHYALGTAREEQVKGNTLAGGMLTRDAGHDGYDLARFVAMPQSQRAGLIAAEVLSLRLYTSTAFREINTPLRERANTAGKGAGSREHWAEHPVPLPATTYFISSAVTKLQELSREGFEGFELWRGLANMNEVTEEYLATGGHELACMSTSRSRAETFHFARSGSPLILKLKVDTHRNVGADISFLSMFPGEQEYLYPPLTHLKPVGEGADLVDKNRNVFGKLITVVPSFPNIDIAEDDAAAQVHSI